MSKTQSVCKHCRQSFDKHGNNGACIIGDTGFLRGTKFEPVSEPASTGEQPPVTEMYLCEAERLFLKPNQLYRFVIHPTCVRCQELELIGAARPSGPSAPQVEPHVICGNCRKTLKWFPSEPHMNHENNDIHCYPGSEETVTLVYVTPAPQTSAEQMSDAHMYLKARAAVRKANDPAAPQPVSGDVTKALALHKRLYNFKAGDSFSDLKRDLMFFLLDISNKMEPSK